jgi:hypothetical protein
MEVRLLAPRAELRLQVAGGSSMIDAARLSYLGEALRALLVLEVRRGGARGGLPSVAGKQGLRPHPPNWACWRCAGVAAPAHATHQQHLRRLPNTHAHTHTGAARAAAVVRGARGRAQPPAAGLPGAALRAADGQRRGALGGAGRAAGSAGGQRAAGARAAPDAGACARRERECVCVCACARSRGHVRVPLPVCGCHCCPAVAHHLLPLRWQLPPSLRPPPPKNRTHTHTHARTRTRARTQVADALSLQFRLPPAGVPPPLPRAAHEVLGGCPAVDALLLTSVWAVAVLRQLAQVRARVCSGHSAVALCVCVCVCARVRVCMCVCVRVCSARRLRQRCTLTITTDKPNIHTHMARATTVAHVPGAGKPGCRLHRRGTRRGLQQPRCGWRRARAATR